MGKLVPEIKMFWRSLAAWEIDLIPSVSIYFSDFWTITLLIVVLCSVIKTIKYWMFPELAWQQVHVPSKVHGSLAYTSRHNIRGMYIAGWWLYKSDQLLSTLFDFVWCETCHRTRLCRETATVRSLDTESFSLFNRASSLLVWINNYCSASRREGKDAEK